ncbi:DegT/DnrJ/EryC1/StrS family aminotransferase [Paenibacillus sp. CF384]|uniref:DegT/DnrJ/EryC1/StrS family aminotransferase n=1 Tax=Paenibacillus sp. CF384 TaxID=1884382 RepID=UPI000895933C|nr:DegT/DnrJ/EryC1/StrS family aminotransferase [Paenibacillus sp. CF384]SDX28617.1 dTDP-4-amino-4,6-dideoxygalactose transaminase [Paenibacillus sp. CF384]
MGQKRFEIGSEFPLDAANLSTKEDTFGHRLKAYQSVFYSSGRGALRGVLRQLQGERALLPAYICQSVIDAFEEENYTVCLYRIKTDLSIDLEDVRSKLHEDTDILFLMHYFGRLQSENDLVHLRDLCDASSAKIIEDTTHSILTQSHSIGDYCVASLRKWFALPDGGVAYCVSGRLDEAPEASEYSFTNARAAGMFLKGLYLNGLAEGNEMYRGLFMDAENGIDNDNKVEAISHFSNELLNTFHVGKAAATRIQNKAYLAENIHNRFVTPVFDKQDSKECSFFYPLFVENRDVFRRYLNENSIFCPVHWPIDDHRLLEFADTRYISEFLISIPIDQRYSLAEMEYICNVINKYSGGNMEG